MILWLISKVSLKSILNNILTENDNILCRRLVTRRRISTCTAYILRLSLHMPKTTTSLYWSRFEALLKWKIISRQFQWQSLTTRKIQESAASWTTLDWFETLITAPISFKASIIGRIIFVLVAILTFHDVKRLRAAHRLTNFWPNRKIQRIFREEL